MVKTVINAMLSPKLDSWEEVAMWVLFKALVPVLKKNAKHQIHIRCMYVNGNK